MSKLADAIRKTQRVEAAPMGFGAPKAAPQATMLVAAIVEAKDVENARAAGADLVLVRGAPGGPAGSGAPAGLLPERLSAAAAREAADQGYDFAAFRPQDAEAAALSEERLGFVVVTAAAVDADDLRALEALNLDAVMLDKPPDSLTVADQLAVARVSMFARKPLFCPVKPSAGKEDLQCLRTAGVAVVVTEDTAAIASLKEAVLSLPPRRTRRDERPTVTLPRGAAQTRDDDEDDDD